MKNKAFTLIEIIVAVSIFSLFIGTATGIFISSINAQRKAIATQRLLDQTSYVMEYMSRALRMAQKDDINGVNCLSGDKVNYEITSSGNGGIRFINHLQNDDCQEFYLDSGQLKFRKGILGSEEILDLTSSSLSINFFQINLFGESQLDNFQPRVTIFLEIEDSKISESPPKVQIQTTISQRNLDVIK